MAYFNEDTLSDFLEKANSTKVGEGIQERIEKLYLPPKQYTSSDEIDIKA